MIPCNFKLVLFFAKSFKKPLKGYIKDRRLNLTLGLSYYVSFSSSLQSHSLWVTLYKVEHLIWIVILLLLSHLMALHEQAVERNSLLWDERSNI